MIDRLLYQIVRLLIALLIILPVLCVYAVRCIPWYWQHRREYWDKRWHYALRIYVLFLTRKRRQRYMTDDEMRRIKQMEDAARKNRRWMMYRKDEDKE
jgi:hypothetical protein